MAHITEPFVELHPDDAATCGIAPGGLAVVESAHGRVIVRAEVTLAQRPGSVFVPMHWTDQLSAASRIDAVVNADRKSTRLTPVTNAHLVCRLLLEKKNTITQ